MSKPEEQVSKDVQNSTPPRKRSRSPAVSGNLAKLVNSNAKADRTSKNTTRRASESLVPVHMIDNTDDLTKIAVTKTPTTSQRRFSASDISVKDQNSPGLQQAKELNLNTSPAVQVSDIEMKLAEKLAELKIKDPILGARIENLAKIALEGAQKIDPKTLHDEIEYKFWNSQQERYREVLDKFGVEPSKDSVVQLTLSVTELALEQYKGPLSNEAADSLLRDIEDVLEQGIAAHPMNQSPEKAKEFEKEHKLLQDKLIAELRDVQFRKNGALKSPSEDLNARAIKTANEIRRNSAPAQYPGYRDFTRTNLSNSIPTATLVTNQPMPTATLVQSPPIPTAELLQEVATSVPEQNAEQREALVSAIEKFAETAGYQVVKGQKSSYLDKNRPTIYKIQKDKVDLVTVENNPAKAQVVMKATKSEDSIVALVKMLAMTTKPPQKLVHPIDPPTQAKLVKILTELQNKTEYAGKLQMVDSKGRPLVKTTLVDKENMKPNGNGTGPK